MHKTLILIAALSIAAAFTAQAKDKDKDKIHNVPDGASTLPLLVISIAGITAARRFIWQ